MKQRGTFFEKATAAATKIQSAYRGHVSRKNTSKRHSSATKIQRKFKSYVQKKTFDRFKPILREQAALDVKLKATRDRLVREEREYVILSMLNGSRLKTYQNQLRESGRSST
jgi:hypothetical protein